MAKLFKNTDIVNTFKLDKNQLAKYIKTYFIYKLFINNNLNHEKQLRDMVNDQLKSINLSIDELLNKYQIKLQIIDIFLTASKFIELQLPQLAKMAKIQSPGYLHYIRKKFLSENTFEKFIAYSKKKKVVFSSEYISNDLHELLKNTNKGGCFNYNNEKFFLKEVYRAPKRHTVYKFFYVVFKDVYEYELRSFVMGIMENYSAKAILDELNLHYGAKLLQCVPRTVVSSSRNEEDQNILYALSCRQGKCFFNTNNPYVTLLLIDSISEEDINLMPEEVSSYKDLILNGLASRISWI